MPPLPTVLLSSVVRSAHKGESHGGLYLLDLETGRRRQMIDWNTCDIDWAGRGLDRGLRGIAFRNEEIWVAAADEIFLYDQAFRVLGSWRNSYLGHCHEICRLDDRLYLSSTGFDSVLEFDLTRRAFTRGWTVRGEKQAQGQIKLRTAAFDPRQPNGPAPGDSVHINNVFADATGIYLSALRLPTLLRLCDQEVQMAARIPVHTHNARPFADGVLVNNTGQAQAEWRNHAGRPNATYPVPRFAKNLLVNGDLPQDHARPSFARGLCVHDAGAEQVVIVGSSPATVSAFNLSNGRKLAQWTLTRDVRNAVHGLEVWPFATPRLDPCPADLALFAPVAGGRAARTA